MKLAIAAPPYPPGKRKRASRWYGSGFAQLGPGAHPADLHPEAELWDDPMRHRHLLAQLMDEYDGWAIATAGDAVDIYAPRPSAARVMIWVKPNAMPGPARIHNKYEAVILYPPVGRRSSRGGIGCTPDVLICPKRNDRFAGSKPALWTEWVLAAMSYNPTSDSVDDIFPGSGSVARVIADLAEVSR